MKTSRDEVKIMIELSSTVEEADEIIKENYDFETTEEKVAFLKGMFDIEIVGHTDETDETTYYSMLYTIIKG